MCLREKQVSGGGGIEAWQWSTFALTSTLNSTHFMSQANNSCFQKRGPRTGTERSDFIWPSNLMMYFEGCQNQKPLNRGDLLKAQSSSCNYHCPKDGQRYNLLIQPFHLCPLSLFSFVDVMCKIQYYRVGRNPWSCFYSMFFFKVSYCEGSFSFTSWGPDKNRLKGWTNYNNSTLNVNN